MKIKNRPAEYRRRADPSKVGNLVQLPIETSAVIRQRLADAIAGTDGRQRIDLRKVRGQRV